VDERPTNESPWTNVRSLQRRWRRCHSERCNAMMALLLQRNDGVATLSRDAGARCATLVKLTAWRWSGLLLQFATQRRCDVLQLATQQRCDATVGCNVAALRQVATSQCCDRLQRHSATTGCNVAALRQFVALRQLATLRRCGRLLWHCGRLLRQVVGCRLQRCGNL
jgi:hypothetical protein